MPSNENEPPLILPPEVIKPFFDAYFATIEQENERRLEEGKEVTRHQAEETVNEETEVRD